MPGIRSKVGPKGQAVIPQAIRDELGIKPGDDVIFHIEKGRATIEPAQRSDPLAALLSAVPNKKAGPAGIDWRKEYSNRFG